MMRHISNLEGLTQSSGLNSWISLIQFFYVMILVISSLICGLFTLIDRKSRVSRAVMFWITVSLLILNIVSSLTLSWIKTLFDDGFDLGVVQVTFSSVGIRNALTGHYCLIVALVFQLLCCCLAKGSRNGLCLFFTDDLVKWRGVAHAPSNTFSGRVREGDDRAKMRRKVGNCSSKHIFRVLFFTFKT